ncbi:TauD/TfdA family dioxygenase [Cocleimonas sp. KMM 6892]|uniref:TauD/TfdA family dioxygenase n=1 Tax=unclassified Cocleimonas TaxID=2639732 RepID=UPI002DC06442|nr:MULTISPECIES: TauD/TfdA family dioxygenase [unclassified Cocleimonas]MEB8433726.1 TauD/TfdA family dioxygenase [Cocleimonas sp. KMM 6892]MEC4716537.1 TauD/TfdA family dioxygenase [Cocleimonas sp. KMM 6895]MEC4746308.1 TauD/TfdA family dioxygenase [Cocleimonas sp. KMM 6896]
MPSPFSLANQESYLRWRDAKLARVESAYQKSPPHFQGIIQNGLSPTENELNNIIKQCNDYCLSLYQIRDHESYDIKQTKRMILSLANKLGLSQLDGNICADEDSLTSITQTSRAGQHEYIPYSTKRLSWHTDGYYNLPQNTIHSMLLHCARQAEEGGESKFMDHEIAYILLRDKNPDYIEALMKKNVLTIPANIQNGKEIRAAQTGPVFSLNTQGQLHMRYSARKRNIEWKQDATTLDAVGFIEKMFESESKYIIKHRLKAGEGIICRNVLHCRTAYVDSDHPEEKRLLFRGRFYDELPLLDASKPS